ncbi:hypothetical protein GCM10010284_40530 [Streptomyces rubiginosohelvolus]|uniref:Uncharacterized protein n=1 Tax=Streptomyces rubiginosohelvolus TaxID=67362 RepID=A0ABQ3CAT0_9ACTN|nr:hypothetical protein GCM10010284_40530 [Streptomyces rubiginosohelvolus]GGZ79327.1 hypothetical protein GCM10010328_62520 [Streptomyces pluricolorescens]
MQDGGPAAFEEGAQLLGPAGGGHPDGEAREGAVRCVVVLHGVFPGSCVPAGARWFPADTRWFPLVTRGAEARDCQRCVTGSVPPYFPAVTSHDAGPRRFYTSA